MYELEKQLNPTDSYKIGWINATFYTDKSGYISQGDKDLGHFRNYSGACELVRELIRKSKNTE